MISSRKRIFLYLLPVCLDIVFCPPLALSSARKPPKPPPTQREEAAGNGMKTLSASAEMLRIFLANHRGILWAGNSEGKDCHTCDKQIFSFLAFLAYHDPLARASDYAVTTRDRQEGILCTVGNCQIQGPPTSKGANAVTIRDQNERSWRPCLSHLHAHDENEIQWRYI